MMLSLSWASRSPEQLSEGKALAMIFRERSAFHQIRHNVLRLGLGGTRPNEPRFDQGVDLLSSIDDAMLLPPGI